VKRETGDEEKMSRRQQSTEPENMTLRRQRKTKSRNAFEVREL